MRRWSACVHPGAITLVHSSLRILTSRHARAQRFQWLRSADIIVIDEVRICVLSSYNSSHASFANSRTNVHTQISMLTATALSGINHALNYVTSNGNTTELQHSFGSKSIIAVGDLYQLPCVQKSRRFTQQIYGSDLWPEFAFAELTESCRVLTGEVAFAEFLSRARKGYKHLIQSDHDMLKSRFCQHHCAVCNTQYPGTDS